MENLTDIHNYVVVKNMICFLMNLSQGKFYNTLLLTELYMHRL